VWCRTRAAPKSRVRSTRCWTNAPAWSSRGFAKSPCWARTSTPTAVPWVHYLARLPALQRIRFTTSHPAEFGDALIEAYAEEPKLASFLHLPVQSGSDRILAMMKRGYTQAQYLDRIRRVRAARPGLSLSTDFIVGFPSESEDDFQRSMDLIEAAQFDSAFSFLYSPRPGTPAANLRDSVPQAEKDARLQRLQARIRELDDAFKRSLVGSTQRVLVEGPAVKGEGLMRGRTSCHRTVNFAAPAQLAGQMVDVVITEALTNSLRGVRREQGEGHEWPSTPSHRHAMDGGASSSP
jgi:tRNA-2-methylthio-N6-dimethylallyladenosine synthase